MWGVNPGPRSESVCPIQPPQPPLGCDFSKLSPPLCLFLEFTMLKWWLEWGWESWSHFHNHNFSRQKRLGKRSAPDFDGRITFSWSLLPVNLLTFFPRRPAFSVECHFKPSPVFFFFLRERERLDIMEDSFQTSKDSELEQSSALWWAKCPRCKHSQTNLSFCKCMSRSI